MVVGRKAPLLLGACTLIVEILDSVHAIDVARSDIDFCFYERKEPNEHFH